MCGRRGRERRWVIAASRHSFRFLAMIWGKGGGEGVGTCCGRVGRDNVGKAVKGGGGQALFGKTTTPGEHVRESAWGSQVLSGRMGLAC